MRGVWGERGGGVPFFGLDRVGAVVAEQTVGTRRNSCRRLQPCRHRHRTHLIPGPSGMWLLRYLPSTVPSASTRAHELK